MAIIAMNIPLAEESIPPTHLMFTSRREGYDSDKKPDFPGSVDSE
jgi:hypothetical protein